MSKDASAARQRGRAPGALRGHRRALGSRARLRHGHRASTARPTSSTRPSTCRCSAVERKRERGLAALERARGALQERVARQMTPAAHAEARFTYDELARPRHAHRRAAGRARVRARGTGRRGQGWSRKAARRSGREPTPHCTRRPRPSCARDEPFCVTTHEAPDGDALGSLLGAGSRCARPAATSCSPSTARTLCPYEYRFLPLDAIERTPPADLEQRTLWAFDCGSARRIGPDEAMLKRRSASSTSTTTTTTRASATSTWWTPAPRAPPRCWRACCRAPGSRCRCAPPRRSTSAS